MYLCQGLYLTSTFPRFITQLTEIEHIHYYIGFIVRDKRLKGIICIFYRCMVFEQFSNATYLWIVMSKLFPALMTTSWASLCLRSKTSMLLILITESPGIRPALSAGVPLLTWNNETENVIHGIKANICESPLKKASQLNKLTLIILK